MKAFHAWAAGLVLALPLAAAAAMSRPATPFTDAELDQLLAPIALYPDAVLSHVLIAATVPGDVEEAAEWSRRHPDLTGQAAVNAVEGKDWDPSVKALVAFPDVLARLDDDPDWTDDVGAAFLDQEGDVMDRVQVLRDRADAAGSLDDLEHVRVVREREYIYLEPAVARVVYVPYYDPWYVYGSWWWPYYPPHCWGYWAGRPVSWYRPHLGFYWGLGFHLAPTYYWGGFNWTHRQVVVTRQHRFFAPTPGYHGNSNVRRDRVAEHRWRNDSGRRAGRASEWRRDTGRNGPTREVNVPRGLSRSPRHESRNPSRREESVRGGRRSATDVQRELGNRRAGRPSVESGGRESRGRSHVRREDRPSLAGRGVERSNRPERIERSVRVEPQRQAPGRDWSGDSGRHSSRDSGRDPGRAMRNDGGHAGSAGRAPNPGRGRGEGRQHGGR
ncbi:MAG: DUF3300 domain-containing protein [Gammaproteobacteria bacterium]